MSLTGGRLLARNVLRNVLATLVLLGSAAVAIPLLIEELGTARFGLLALAWAVLGTFGVLDLGLGRALTAEVAKRAGEATTELPGLVSTFLALFVGLGLVLGTALWLGASWLARDLFDLAPGLQAEATDGARLLGLAVPLVLVTTGLRGVLEAYQRFDLVNAIRVPTGLFTLTAPLLILPFSQSISAAVAALVGVRALSFLAHLVCYARVLKLPLVPPERRLLLPVLRASGWFTAANLAQPLLIYPDRFIVGATLTASAVAYYAAPHDLATKLIVIPAAPIPVLFPAFVSSSTDNRQRTIAIFTRSVRYMTVFVVPIVLITVTFADEGMQLWLGEEFARESTTVLQLLAIGVLFQALAQIPFALLQGVGRADLTAKLLLAESLPYLLALWLAIKSGGIEGAAAVWLARAAIDAIALYAMAARILLLPGELIVRATLAFVGFLLMTAALVPLPFHTAGKGVALGVILVGFGLLAWTWILSREERRQITGPVRVTRG